MTWRLLFLYSLCCLPGEKMRLKEGARQARANEAIFEVALELLELL